MGRYRLKALASTTLRPWTPSGGNSLHGEVASHCVTQKVAPKKMRAAAAMRIT